MVIDFNGSLFKLHEADFKYGTCKSCYFTQEGLACNNYRFTEPKKNLSACEFFSGYFDLKLIFDSMEALEAKILGVSKISLIDLRYNSEAKTELKNFILHRAVSQPFSEIKDF